MWSRLFSSSNTLQDVLPLSLRIPKSWRKIGDTHKEDERRDMNGAKIRQFGDGCFDRITARQSNPKRQKRKKILDRWCTIPHQLRQQTVAH
jgi:hypothetical protein